MSDTKIGKLWHKLSHVERWTVCLWAFMLVVSLVRVGISPEKHSVYPNFTEAASRWVHGSDLYAARGSYDFRYSPIVAIGFTPLLLLGNRYGGMVWCILSTGLLVASIAYWLKAGTPRRLSGQERGAVFLLMLPLAIGNIASNQTNALVLAMLLVAITAVQTKWFTTASLAIVGAFLFKLYPLSLGLILILIYPWKMNGKLLLLIIAGFLLPFLFQRTAYVKTTYRNWGHYLTVEDRSTAGPDRAYRDFQFLLHDLSLPIAQKTYRTLELAVAAAFGAFCLMARLKHWPSARLNFFAFTLAICWMTVFGPATESMTYLLVAPVVCWLLIAARFSRPSWTWYLYLLSYLLLLYPPFAGMFGSHTVFRNPRLKSIQPLAVLLLLAGTLIDAMRSQRVPLAGDITTAYNLSPDAPAL